ncbi:MAG: GxxExxY protein [Aequorivita sp.]
MLSKKSVTQLSYEITGLAIKVHKALGPGLLELTYMKLLKKPQGLLIIFFADNIKKLTTPFVNEYFGALPD